MQGRGSVHACSQSRTGVQSPRRRNPSRKHARRRGRELRSRRKQRPPAQPNPKACPQSRLGVHLAPQGNGRAAGPAQENKEKGQGPAVPTSGPPPLGDEPVGGILAVEFFSRVTCEGTYKQHSAAIKYYRKVCEHANLETLSFSNERMAEVDRASSWTKLLVRRRGPTGLVLVYDGCTDGRRVYQVRRRGR